MTEEQSKFIENNHNLIYRFLNKYHLSIDEHYDLAAIGLCKAGLTYDADKSSFSTYAFRCMYTSVMYELRKKSMDKTIPEHQIVYYQANVENEKGDTLSYINFIPSKENVEDNVLSEVIFDEYEKTLKDRDKQIFVLFRQGYNQSEIGRLVGCSQPQVSRVKKKLVEYLVS